MRIQPRVRGGRRRVGTAVIQAIERKLREEMRAHGVSRSFVIATALAWVFDVDEQADYRTPRRRR